MRSSFFPLLLALPRFRTPPPCAPLLPPSLSPLPSSSTKFFTNLQNPIPKWTNKISASAQTNFLKVSSNASLVSFSPNFYTLQCRLRLTSMRLSKFSFFLSRTTIPQELSAFPFHQKNQSQPHHQLNRKSPSPLPPSKLCIHHTQILPIAEFNSTHLPNIAPQFHFPHEQLQIHLPFL